MGHVKFIVNYTLELFTAGVLALGSFVFLFWLLNNIFPIGAGLDVLINNNSSSIASNEIRNRALWVSKNDQNSDLSASTSGVAVLTSTLNNVKNKQVDQLAWKTAKKGLSLFGGDSIQTFDGSRATIKFNENSELELGENSLIVINRLEDDIIWNEKKSYMVMVEGSLRSKISPDSDKTVYVEISTPNTTASVRSKSNLIDFHIKIHPNKSSTVSVYEGIANISSQDGSKVEIKKNQASLINTKGKVTTPEILPTVPTLHSPADNDVVYFKDIPPSITFRWKKSNHSDKYRIILAKDEKFTLVLVDKVIKGTEFNYRNLKHGTYFWRASGVTNNNAESFPSSYRTINIIQDSTPPPLNLVFPQSITGQKKYPLAGQTEASATIYINGEKITHQNGQFSHTLVLKRGPNIIVVESVDKLGNVTYKTETINGKF